MNSMSTFVVRATRGRGALGPGLRVTARCGAVLLLALLCGCFKTKDELTLEADGSGKVRIETRTSLPAEMLAGLGLGARAGASETFMYPPISEAEAKKFFPSQAFTVTTKAEKAGDAEQVLVVEAAFKDVNALLASPYARAHALTLKMESGQLVFRALSGIEAAARFSEMKDE